MNKISLIIQREYITRVKKKSFIIMTLLSPIIFAAIAVVPTWLSSQEDTKEKVIVVDDATKHYAQALKSTQYIKYELLTSTEEQQTKQELAQQFDALLLIENDLLQNEPIVQLYSEGQVTMDVIDNIKTNLNTYIRQLKLESYDIENLDIKIKELNQLKVKVKTTRLDEDGTEKQSSAEMAIIIGMASAFLIYMIMILYATQVMRGVIEEKTSRIVEVIISSVKPFQLMMGKIIGIGLVALTQFFLWIILTLGVLFTAQVVFLNTSQPQEITQSMDKEQITNPEVNSAETAQLLDKITTMMGDANLPFILAIFIFYFIGGYLVK